MAYPRRESEFGPYILLQYDNRDLSKDIGKFSRRGFLEIFESMKGVVQDIRGCAPRSPSSRNASDLGVKLLLHRTNGWEETLIASARARTRVCLRVYMFVCYRQATCDTSPSWKDSYVIREDDLKYNGQSKYFRFPCLEIRHMPWPVKSPIFLFRNIV